MFKIGDRVVNITWAEYHLRATVVSPTAEGASPRLKIPFDFLAIIYDGEYNVSYFRISALVLEDVYDSELYQLLHSSSK